MKVFIASTTVAVLTLFASAQGPNEETNAAAAKLLKTMGVQEEMSVGFKSAMEPMLAPMIQELGLNEKQIVELNQIFTSWWEEDIDQNALIAKIQAIYAERFTVEELNDLVAFYETELGQKILHLMPELTQEGMQIGMEAAGAQQGKLMEKMQAFQERVAAENAPAEEKEAPAEGE